MSKPKLFILITLLGLSVASVIFLMLPGNENPASETPASIIPKEQPAPIIQVEQVPMPVDQASE